MDQIFKVNGRNYRVDLSNNRVTFLDGRFYYHEESGTFQPSVTTILDAYPKGAAFYEWLKKNGEDADEIRDDAGRRGSKLHDMTEKYDKGELVTLFDEKGEVTCKMGEWAMMNKYVEFRTKFPHDVIDIEQNLVSGPIADGGLGCGGTRDRIIQFTEGPLAGKKLMTDIKTGNYLAPYFWLQLVTYGKLEQEETGQQFDGFGILHLNAKTRSEGKKGSMQGPGWQFLYITDPAEINTYWKRFKAVQMLWLAENETLQPKNTVFAIKLQMTPAATEGPQLINQTPSPSAYQGPKLNAQSPVVDIYTDEQKQKMIDAEAERLAKNKPGGIQNEPGPLAEALKGITEETAGKAADVLQKGREALQQQLEGDGSGAPLPEFVPGTGLQVNIDPIGDQMDAQESFRGAVELVNERRELDHRFRKASKGMTELEAIDFHHQWLKMDDQQRSAAAAATDEKDKVITTPAQPITPPAKTGRYEHRGEYRPKRRKDESEESFQLRVDEWKDRKGLQEGAEKKDPAESGKAQEGPKESQQQPSTPVIDAGKGRDEDGKNSDEVERQVQQAGEEFKQKIETAPPSAVPGGVKTPEELAAFFFGGDDDDDDNIPE